MTTAAIEKDYTMYGVKITNPKTNEIELLLYTWSNVYADADIPFAACVDANGKKYNIEMDYITPVEE